MAIIALLILIYIVILTNKRIDKYSPSIVLLIIWMLFLSSEKIYSLYLGIDGIAIQTYLVILLALSFFCIGDIVSSCIKVRSLRGTYSLSEKLVKSYSYFSLLICATYIFTQLEKSGLQVFYFNEQYIEAFYNIRQSSIEDLNKINIASNVLEMLKIITLYIYYKIKKDNKKIIDYKIFCLSILILAISMILTGAKQNVITFFIGLLVADIYSKNKVGIKSIMLMIVFIFVMFIMLFLLNNANLATNSNTIESIMKIFESYVLSALYGFDTVILNDFYPGYNGGWLKPIYALFYRIGIINNYPITHMDYFYNKGIISNIYTGLFFYYQNLGLLELLMMMAINGFIYKLVYRYFRANHMFSTMLFPIIMSSLLLSPINGNFIADSIASMPKYLFIYWLLKKSINISR